MDSISLYRFSAIVVAKNFSKFKAGLTSLPTLMVYDIYEQMLYYGKISDLYYQLRDVTHFVKLLQRTEKWNILFHLVQSVADNNPEFLTCLAAKKACACIELIVETPADHWNTDNTLFCYIADAFRLSNFFLDAGHFNCAAVTLSFTTELTRTLKSNFLPLQFDLWNRLLHIYTLDCRFHEAKSAFWNVEQLFEALNGMAINTALNVVPHYTITSLYLFALSDYDKAYQYALEAVKGINSSCSVRDAIDALRQAAKTCIVKRRFKPAELLVKQAVQLSRTFFGEKSPKFAESLSDFAFYLLNMDSVAASVQVYKDSLKVRQEALGEVNVLTAISREDLAYALYVRDYSIGVFSGSSHNAEVAISTLTKLLPDDHLLLASSKRVKALILEELAIDNNEKEEAESLLQEAEQLHLESLKLARNCFGENNVQTAKHYGNLGRLYQSMKKYNEAEKMHLRAIEIKEHLLGREDYEVALSLGHLASLYNYDMGKYEDAERLYHRSVRIGIDLFGVSYSGLEYDYRGLIYLYAHTQNYVEMARYHMVLADWEQSRRDVDNSKPVVNMCTWENVSIAELVDRIKSLTANGDT